MRAPALVAAIVCITPFAFSPTGVQAQACLGLPGDQVSAMVGFEGTDGASGGSASLSLRSGRASLEVNGSSLDRFAQADDDVSVGGRLTVQLNEGPTALCASGGTSWTSYGSSRSASRSGTGPIIYDIAGNYTRLRTPVGFSVGHAFMRDRTVSLIPFASFAATHDYERMRWLADGTETRSTFGMGAALGVTVHVGRVFLRSQLANTETSDRALSGHNNHPRVLAHFGWVF